MAFRVFRAADRGERAERMLVEGRNWVTAIAATHVLPEFRESFLRRNPVNLALLSPAAS